MAHIRVTIEEAKVIVKGDVRPIVKIEPKADIKPEAKMNVSQ